MIRKMQATIDFQDETVKARNNKVGSTGDLAKFKIKAPGFCTMLQSNFLTI